VERFLATWNARDLDAVVALFAPDAVIEGLNRVNC